MRTSLFGIGLLCSALACASATKPSVGVYSERHFVLSPQQRDDLHIIRDCTIHELATYGFSVDQSNDTDGRYIFTSPPEGIGSGLTETDRVIVRIFPRADSTGAMTVKTWSLTHIGDRAPVAGSAKARRAEGAVIGNCASAAESAAATR